MKKFFKASVAVLSILLCFGACSSSKPPEEPMTTAKQSVTYKNEIGQTVPVAENIGDYEEDVVMMMYDSVVIKKMSELEESMISMK